MGRMRRPTAIERPSGTYFVFVGRTGVEPSGGCALGFPFWAVSRLRWQLGPRTWSIEVSAPWSERRWNARSRRLERWSFKTRGEAEAFLSEVVDRVRRGEFDHA
jgi:hypothetical protein